MCSTQSARSDHRFASGSPNYSSGVPRYTTRKHPTPRIHVMALPRAVLSPDSMASIRKKTPLSANNAHPRRTQCFTSTSASCHVRCCLAQLIHHPISEHLPRRHVHSPSYSVLFVRVGPDRIDLDPELLTVRAEGIDGTGTSRIPSAFGNAEERSWRIAALNEFSAGN